MLVALGVSWVFALFTSQAAPPTDMQAGLREQLGIPPDYQVVFEDPHGAVLSFDQFKADMASRPFDVSKDQRAHRAVLRLESDAQVAQNATKKPAAPMAIVGHAFPSFRATTLDGAAVSLASLRGKPFLASFFFAECGPCIAETPVLSAFHRAHPGVAVVAFTFDDAATAREFVRARHLTWPVVPGQQALADQVGVATYPMLVAVDAQGHVRKAANTASLQAKGKPLTVRDLEQWSAAGD
jgi:peroxiredoxin